MSHTVIGLVGGIASGKSTVAALFSAIRPGIYVDAEQNVYIGGSPERPSELVRIDTRSGALETIRRSSSLVVDESGAYGSRYLATEDGFAVERMAVTEDGVVDEVLAADDEKVVYGATVATDEGVVTATAVGKLEQGEEETEEEEDK